MMSEIARVSPTKGFLTRDPEEITASMLSHMDSGSAPAVETLRFTGSLDTQLINIPAEELILVQGERDGNFVEFLVGTPTDPRDVYLDMNTSKIHFTAGQSPDNYTTFKIWYRHTVTVSGLRASKVGGILRTLIEAIAIEFDHVYDLVKGVFDSGLVDYAKGLSLDWLCALILGTPETYPDGTPTPRLQPTKASGYATFYGQPGDSIATNTRIQTSGTTTSIFEMSDKTKDISIPIGATDVKIKFKAVTAGSLGNRATGTINSIVNSSTVSSGVTVNNLTPFAGGSDLETDPKLGERAKTAILTSGRATLDAITYAVLALSGIAGVHCNDISTSDKILKGLVVVNVVGDQVPIDVSSDLWIGKIDSEVPDSYDGVVETVKKYKAAGVSYQITQPYLVIVDIYGRLKVSTGKVFATMRETVKTEIQSYFDSLSTGNDVKYADLLKRIMALEGVEDFIIDRYYRSDATNFGMGSDDMHLCRTNAGTENNYYKFTCHNDNDGIVSGDLKLGREVTTNFNTYWWNGSNYIAVPATITPSATGHLLIGVASAQGEGNINSVQMKISSSTSTGTLLKAHVQYRYNSQWNNITGELFDSTHNDTNSFREARGLLHWRKYYTEEVFSHADIADGYYIKIDINTGTFGGTFNLDDFHASQQEIAQTFKAENDKLRGVRIDTNALNASAPNFKIGIYAVDGSYYPTGTVIEEITVDATDVTKIDYYYDGLYWFETPPSLTIGTHYALVFTPISNDWDDYHLFYDTLADNLLDETNSRTLIKNSQFDSGTWLPLNGGRDKMDLSFQLRMRPVYKLGQSFYTGVKVVPDERRVVSATDPTILAAVDETKTPCRQKASNGLLAVHEAADLDNDLVYESKSVTNPTNYGAQTTAEISETTGDITLDISEEPSLAVSQRVVGTYEHYDIEAIVGARITIQPGMKYDNQQFLAGLTNIPPIQDAITVRIETDNSDKPSGNLMCGNEVQYCIIYDAATTKYEEYTNYINDNSNDVPFTVATINDAIHLGSDQPFEAAKIDLTTVNTSNDFVIEYHNGTAWVEVPYKTDGTFLTDFPLKQDGYLQFWETPEDWAQQTIFGRTAYFIRIRLTVDGTPGAMSIRQAWLGFAQCRLTVDQWKTPALTHYTNISPFKVLFPFRKASTLEPLGYKAKLWLVIRPELHDGMLLLKTDVTGTNYLQGKLEEYSIENGDWITHSGEQLTGVFAEEVTIQKSGSTYYVEVSERAKMTEATDCVVVGVFKNDETGDSADEYYLNGGSFDVTKITLTDRATEFENDAVYACYAYDPQPNTKVAVDLLFEIMIEKKINPPGEAAVADPNIIIDGLAQLAQHSIKGDVTITEII